VWTVLAEPQVRRINSQIRSAPLLAPCPGEKLSAAERETEREGEGEEGGEGAGEGEGGREGGEERERVGEGPGA